MNKGRIKWLDFSKGFIILLVVLGHCVTGGNIFSKILQYILFIAIMPLFFAVSGFLYKPTNSLHKYVALLYKKIGSFLIPYVLFTIISILAHVTLDHNLFDNFYRIYYIPVGYLWFLYALFFIFIIVGLMDLLHINIYAQICISVMLMFAQMFLPWQESIKGNINPLAGIGGYMICFYLGNIIKRFHLIKYLSCKEVKFINLFAVLVIAEMFITKFLGVGYNTDVFNVTDFITKLLSIPTFFAIFINFNQNSKIFKYFDKYGKYTLIIYLVHMPIISNIMQDMGSINPIIVFITSLLVSWYFSIFICWLSRKSKIVNFLFYPRRYFDKKVIRTNWGKNLLLR